MAGTMTAETKHAEGAAGAADAKVAKVAKVPPQRWRPGVSGNPSGLPRHVLPSGQTVREAARSATPQALAFLVATVNNLKAPLQMRIAAALGIARMGHADALPHGAEVGETKVIVIEKLPEATGPVPGVICSPIKEHVWQKPPPSLHVVTTLDNEEQQ